MAFFPGNPRSDNRRLGEGTPPNKGTMDADQESMKSRNASLAASHRVPGGPAPGAAVPGGSSMPQPFKVRVGG